MYTKNDRLHKIIFLFFLLFACGTGASGSAEDKTGEVALPASTPALATLQRVLKQHDQEQRRGIALSEFALKQADEAAPSDQNGQNQPPNLTPDDAIKQTNDQFHRAVHDRLDYEFGRASPAERVANAQALKGQADLIKKAYTVEKSSLTKHQQDQIQSTISTKEAAANAWLAPGGSLPALSHATEEAAITPANISFLVCGGRVIDSSRSALHWQPDVNQFATDHSSLFQSVGRYDIGFLAQSGDGTWRLQPGKTKSVATVFAIAPRLVMTNAHVLVPKDMPPFAIQDQATHEWRYRPDVSVTIAFNREYAPRTEYSGCAATSPPLPLGISAIVALDRDLDAAILMTDSDLPVGTTMVDTNASDHGPTDAVVTVGYDEDDNYMTPGEEKAFLGVHDQGIRFGYKRMAPGNLMDEVVPAQFFVPARDFEHNAATLEGCSGSPVFRMEDGKFVGLHHDGLWSTANAATEAKNLQIFIKDAKEKARLLARGQGTAPRNESLLQ